MGTEERARILRMVAEGKVTAEEAATLLDALEPPVAEVRTGSPPATYPSPSRRSLVINVTEKGKDKVNLRIPLGVASAAGKFVPRRAQEYLDEYDIDLKQMLSDLGSNLTEGPLLEVTDDEDHVRIAVE